VISKSNIVIQRRRDALHTTRIQQVYYRQPDVYDSVWKWTLKWKHLVKKILKLNVNLSSCLNLFSIWDLLKCMIAILLYKYCQQYLYKKVYKYCYSLPPLPPKKSWTLSIMIIFLFCYGVLMKLCFYLKNHN
jgi:hypothetical protein